MAKPVVQNLCALRVAESLISLTVYTSNQNAKLPGLQVFKTIMLNSSSYYPCFRPVHFHDVDASEETARQLAHVNAETEHSADHAEQLVNIALVSELVHLHEVHGSVKKCTATCACQRQH